MQEGKGTREWTLQQQQDILDKGKAYDDNGKAFEGQTDSCGSSDEELDSYIFKGDLLQVSRSGRRARIISRS